MKSETLTIGDLCAIHVGKSVEIFNAGLYTVQHGGLLVGLTKDSEGYVLDVNGQRRKYSLTEADATRIRLYE